MSSSKEVVNNYMGFGLSTFLYFNVYLYTKKPKFIVQEYKFVKPAYEQYYKETKLEKTIHRDSLKKRDF